MGLVAGFFNRQTAIATPAAKTKSVSSTIVGTVHTVPRLLGPTSTLTLVAGTNSNLKLVGSNIQTTVAIAKNSSQQAIVREVFGLLALEYPVTITATT